MNAREVHAGERPIRDVNAEIRAAVGDGRDVVVRDARSRHNLAVGLSADARVHIAGSVGYYCGGLNDGARIEIERNAGWAVGEAWPGARWSSGATRACRRVPRCGVVCCTSGAMPVLAAELR